MNIKLEKTWISIYTTEYDNSIRTSKALLHEPTILEFNDSTLSFLEFGLTDFTSNHTPTKEQYLNQKLKTV
jgi:hypothetical protein